MDGKLMLKLVMLVRLQDFLRAYPFGDEPADQEAARFSVLLGRLQALVAQQQEGQVARKAQNEKHQELRRRITRMPLRHLARIGGSLKTEHPEVAAAIAQPLTGLSGNLFLATAQNIAAAVQGQHDLLRSKGMSEGTAQDLSTLLAAYSQAVSDANAGLRAHTGARAEIRSLSRELMAMVRQLEGIVLYLFRDREEVLGAWKSARNVAWPLPEVAKPAVPAPASDGQATR